MNVIERIGDKVITSLNGNKITIEIICESRYEAVVAFTDIADNLRSGKQVKLTIPPGH